MQGKLRSVLGMLCVTGILAISGCGGGSSSVTSTSTPSTPATPQGAVNFIVSDDSTQDWATIGVKILSAALVPQGGGTPVTIYTAPSPVPVTNLVQLDQLGELFGNLAAPAGTYTAVVLTLSANPGDVSLIAASDPEAGFDGTAGQAVPASQIQIQKTQGNSGSLTVP